MSGTINREFVAQGLITLVVVIGAWLMFVDPKSTQLRELEQTILASTKPVDQPSMPGDELAQQAASLRKRISEIAQQNNAAVNSSELYSHIGQLAQQHGVVVQNMRPGAQAEEKEKGRVQSIRIDMSIEGPYRNAAEFLDAVTAVSGFVRPVTMTVSPIDRNGVQLVIVRYVCEVLQFELPESLMAFRETSDEI